MPEAIKKGYVRQDIWEHSCLSYALAFPLGSPSKFDFQIPPANHPRPKKEREEIMRRIPHATEWRLS
jgi:hypothetical protein